MGWADRETAWVSLSQSPARRGSRRLALCLSSLSVTGLTASRRHGVTASRRRGTASLSLSVSHSRSVASGSRSLTFLSSFFFSFFSFGFSVFAFSVWFWTAEG